MTSQEADILKQLSDRPREALVSIMDNYSRLLWSIAEKYLTNPEDIKECINDTLMEFYQRRDSFDPQKGSLPVFLGTIARNQAISKYRYLRSRQVLPFTREPEDRTDEIQELEQRIDLNQLIDSLKPEDARIVRMKYYDDLTIQEIADSLKLPYETVKKRHQRSLHKMRWLLMVLLLVGILALLSACAYLVLRRLHLIPGYGISALEQLTVYALEEPVQGEGMLWDTVSDPGEQSVPAELTSAAYTVEEGYLLDGKLTLLVRFPSETTSIPSASVKYDDKPLQQCQIYSSADAACPEDLLVSYQYLADLPEGAGDEVPEDEIHFTFLIDGGSGETSLQLKRIETDELSGYTIKTGDFGEIIAYPHWENGYLLVSLYPVSYENTRILPTLITDQYRQGRTGDITLTEKNPIGAIPFPGEFTSNRFGNTEYYDWNFGKIGAGDYKLCLPYLYLELPGADGEFLLSSRELNFPSGTAPSTEPNFSAEPASPTKSASPGEPDGDLPELPQTCQLPEGTLTLDSCTFAGIRDMGSRKEREWELLLHYEPDSDLELFRPQLNVSLLDENGEEIMAGSVGISIPEEETEPGTLKYLLDISMDSPAFDSCRISLGESSVYRWPRESVLSLRILPGE